jgi:hypothetical protein
VEEIMRIETRRTGAFDVAARIALAITAALEVSGSMRAEEGKWSFKLGAMHMDAYGHDQHVLTIHEVDLGSTPRRDDRTAVTLDTEAGIAYRSEVQYTKGKWGAGADFFLFLTSQSTADRTAAAGTAGPIDEVAFEVADRTFRSTSPSQVLFYSVLEDTDLEVWTLDLYGRRTLTGTPESGIHLQAGLRFGDFDNDYRAVVGIQNVAGSQLDATSNYDRMMGPLVGLAGNVAFGRSSIEGYIGQSVLFGKADLTGMSREFTGPFTTTPAYFDQEAFHRLEQDVAIPITELRIEWTYRVLKSVFLAAGVNTSVWWDVPVPPGVIPTEAGDAALHENTIVFFGAMGAVKFTF